MNLRLSDEQVVLLREVLDGAYRDLKYEIGKTDNSVFRDQLRHRRDAIRAMLFELGGPVEVSA